MTILIGLIIDYPAVHSEMSDYKVEDNNLCGLYPTSGIRACILASEVPNPNWKFLNEWSVDQMVCIKE